MKIKLVLLLACAALISTTAAASTHQGAFALKAGYFLSTEDESVPNQYDLEMGESLAVGAEYYALTRGDSAYSFGLFYTKPDIEGKASADNGVTWLPVSAEAKLWQLSANYYKFQKSTKMGLNKYEGFFYGAGLGYSDVTLDSVTVGGTTYAVAGLGDNSADANLMLGYKWSEGIGVEAKWIVDEDAITLMAGYWWGD